MWTYLLILRSCRGDVVHQDGHQLCDPVDTSGKGAIWGIAIDSLALVLSLFEPFSGYRVYNVEHTKFVCAWGLLKVCKDLLDQKRLGLKRLND